MYNVSGKFSSPKSHFNGEENIEGLADQIPPTPVSRREDKNPVVEFVTEYFGRFWWLWLILLILKMVRYESGSL